MTEIKTIILCNYLHAAMMALQLPLLNWLVLRNSICPWRT